METFKQEIHGLEQKAQQVEESLDSLAKLQQRYVEFKKSLSLIL